MYVYLTKFSETSILRTLTIETLIIKCHVQGTEMYNRIGLAVIMWVKTVLQWFDQELVFQIISEKLIKFPE